MQMRSGRGLCGLFRRPSAGEDYYEAVVAALGTKGEQGKAKSGKGKRDPKADLKSTWSHDLTLERRERRAWCFSSHQVAGPFSSTGHGVYSFLVVWDSWLSYSRKAGLACQGLGWKCPVAVLLAVAFAIVPLVNCSNGK